MAQACQTALILTMDVSNSVDIGEFRIQIDGLAAALQDPEIVETLVHDQVALSVIQWSGSERQAISLDWHQMRSAADVADFACKTRNLPRAFVLSDTAPAEAMQFAIAHFSGAPTCNRRVIDISGDGTANAGGSVASARRLAERRGITINGLAIESLGLTISNYYRNNLRTRDGFVMTARGFRDYPPTIRAKLIRELSRLFGAAPNLSNGQFAVLDRRHDSRPPPNMGPANTP